MRYEARAAGPDQPEYPVPGAQIDYYFAAQPAGEVKVEILDAGGKPLRTISSEDPAPRGAGGQDMRAPARFSGGFTRVAARAGLNRLVWDLRHTAGNSGAAGPLVTPGKYQVRLTAAGTSQTRTLEVRIDPRVAADGVTQADLQEQADLLLKIRDTLVDARRLQERLDSAMQKEGLKPPAPPGPGESPTAIKYASPLQAAWAKLVNAPGPYPQIMLIDQLQNVARMLGQGDQKPGKDAWDRYNDLRKELNAIKSEVDKISP
jgi:hypothetical protein